MAIMMGKLYTALRAADVPEDKAVDAAEEVAGFETRLSSLDSRMRLMQWMLTFNLAMTAAILLKLFVPPIL